MQYSKGTLVASLAAAVLALGAPQAADAQQPPPPPPTDSVAMPSPMAATDTVTVAQLLLALDSIDVRTAALDSATTFTRVQLVDLRALLGDPGDPGIDTVIVTRAPQIDLLREKVAANPSLVAALGGAAQPVEVAHVVALDVRNGTELVVFYRPVGAAPPAALASPAAPTPSPMTPAAPQAQPAQPEPAQPQPAMPVRKEPVRPTPPDASVPPAA